MINEKELKKIRGKFGFSQEDLATKLGLSRPTISKIESGDRKLNNIEKARLEEIFGIAKEERKNEISNIRIDIPQKRIDKFKQVLLYITQKVGSKPNVGMTVLYKLLYFIDFDYYEKYEDQLMGLTYFKNTHGPTPREFVKVVNEMKDKGEITEIKNKYFSHDQKKFLPIKEADLSKLSAQELEMIDDVLARYSNKSGKELSELSHMDIPWACAENGEDLKYEHVFYRSDKFSVTEYEDL
jgi:transcriptional regulator with XRE-family HTH domain